MRREVEVIHRSDTDHKGSDKVQAPTDGGQSVLSNEFRFPVVVRRADSGVTGLVVDVDDIERAESGLDVLGDAPDERGLPCNISKYSDGEGFHDVRWKLFFLRTLAL